MDFFQFIAEAFCWMVIVIAGIGFAAMVAATVFIIWLEIRDMWRGEENGNQEN